MTPTRSQTFRVFVSSTFGDMKAERNALQEHVFPRLRTFCAQHGALFQAIDLRWGVSEEAALDQQTMNICLGEIEHCQQTSPRPNFIVLLGDRYGWCPPPLQIPATEFIEILNRISSRERGILETWYLRDENALPVEYVLQPRKPGGEYENYANWTAVEKLLREILVNAVNNMDLDQEARLKYEASATHQEIATGALNVKGANEHVFCFFRMINGLPQDNRSKDYQDFDLLGKPDREMSNRLSGLKKHLASILQRNVYKYNADWMKDGITSDHLNRLCEDVYNSLAGVIRIELEKLEEIDDLQAEISAHQAFRDERLKFFTGRRNVLINLEKYIRIGSQHPFALWGKSGSGKSAVMAKTVEWTLESLPNAIVIERYIGVTPNSSNILVLLYDLCRQINRFFGKEEKINYQSNFNKLAQMFRECLNLATIDKPLVIFLDAMDMLEQSDISHQLSWLPTDLPQYSKIIVSTLPEPYQFMPKLRSMLPHQNLLELQAMSLQNGKITLESWLCSAGRTLQDKQREEVLAKFEENGLPLYLRLAFEEARRWHSYDDIPLCEGVPGLAKGVPGIIGNLFWRFSQPANHGSVLVARSLGYLAAAKNGLSENELLDVLSLDEEVMEDFKIRSPKSPDITRLPVVVWSRLYFDLQPYLSERRTDGTSLITFYHRQLGEVIRNKFLSGGHKIKIHQMLAKYFADQPLLIKKGEQEITNLRKLSELPYQLSQAKAWQQLSKLLADLEFFGSSWKVNQYEVKFYWTQVEANSELSLVESFQRVIDAPEQYVRFSWDLATLLHDTGHTKESLHLRRFIVDHYRRAEDSQKLVGALGNLAALYHDLGNLDEALILLREQKRLCYELDDMNVLANNLGNQALIFQNVGELERARELHEEEERLCRTLGDRAGTARSLGNQGMIASTRGDMAKAMTLFKEQERICRELGNRNGLASALGNQGSVFLRYGDIDRALVLFTEQEGICRELGDKVGLASALGNRGIILKMKGNLEEALTLQREVESLFRELGNNDGLANTLGNQALLQRALGELETAMTLLKEQEHLYRGLNNKVGLASGLGNQALILSDCGQFAEAMRLLREQENICRQLGNKDGLQRSLGNQANILTSIGDLDNALILHQEKESICRELGDTKGFAIALANQASILGKLGNPHQALPLVEKAIKLLESHGLTRVAGQIKPILEDLRLQFN